MTTSPPPTSRERRFTRGDERGPGKRLWIPLLLLLLIAAIGGFIYWMWPRPTPAVWFAALGVAEYDDLEGTPTLAFAQWSLEELNQRQTADCLRPWQRLATGSGTSQRPQPRVSSVADVETWRNELANAAQRAGIRNHDTLVVYLRGHCLADPGNRDHPLWLLTGEFTCRGLAELRAASGAEGSGAASPADLAARTRNAGMVSLVAVLEELGNLPAGQVVVLLDGCDLPVLPGADVLANPVPAAVATCCKMLQGKTSTPLWIIPATANLQPSHVSEIRQRTLLQAAAEFAGRLEGDKPAADQNADGRVSLAEFYDQLLRFAWTSSGEGQQTPLLMKAGMDQAWLPGSSSPEWEDAADVMLALVDRKALAAKKRADKAADQDNEDETAASRARRSGPRGLALAAVSLWPQEPAGDPVNPAANPAPAASNPAAPGDNPATAPQNPEPAPVPPTPDEQFWLDCQLLAARQLAGSSAGFSPVDFAPHVWNELLVEGIRGQRQKRIDPASAASVALSGPGLLIKQLEGNSATAFPAGDQTPAARVGRGWDGLRGSFETSGGAFDAWLRPERLPRSIGPRWLERRDLLRSGADGFAQFAPWLSWSLHRPGDVDEVRKTADRFAECFGPGGSISQLVSDPAGLNPSGPAERTSVDQAGTSLDALHAAIITTTIRDLEQRAAGAGRPWHERLSWTDERLLLDLLDQPLLTPIERKALTRLLDEIRMARSAAIARGEREPGPRLTERQPAELLQNASATDTPEGFLASRQSWCAMIGQLMAVCGNGATAEPLPDPPLELAGLAPWCSATRNRLASDSARTDSGADVQSRIAAWCRACWQGLFDVQPAETVIVALVPPLREDPRLFLEAGVGSVQLTSIGGEQPVQILIKRGDGRPVDTAELVWQTDPPAAPLVFKFNNQPVPALEPFRINNLARTAAGELASFEVATTDAPAGFLRCRLSLSASTNGANSGPEGAVAFDVLAPNPDRVDLLVECLNPDDPARTGQRTSCEVQAGGDLPVLATPLEVPAIGTLAARKYRVLLANQSAKPRKVRLTVYAAEGQGSESGIGTGSDWNPEWQPPVLREGELPESALFVGLEPMVELPAAGPGESGGAVEIKLRQAVEELTVRRFNGLLCVVEDVLPGEADGPPRRDPSGSRFQFWIPCRATNPYASGLLNLKPDPGSGSEGLRLDCFVNREPAPAFALANLPLTLAVRDFDGRSLGSVTGKLLPAAESGANGGAAGGRAWSAGLAFLPTSIAVGWKRPALGAVTIGDYQRAALFRSELKPREAPEPADRAYVRLDLEGTTLQPRSPPPAGEETPGLVKPQAGLVKPQGGPEQADAWIVPSAVGADANRSPDRLELNRILMPVLLDSPYGVEPRFGIRIRDSRGQDIQPPWELATDRVIVPFWKAGAAGELLFSARADDVVFAIRNPDEIGSGLCRVDVVQSSADADESVLASAQLLFDRDKPLSPVVELMGETDQLYEDTSLRFRVQPEDALTGIRQVWFAVIPNQGNTYPLDGILELAQPRGADEEGAWILEIQGENLSDRGFGSALQVVVRCEDGAGNVQDECRLPAAFVWNERPAPKAEGDGGQR